ncbi:probable cellobiose dehydrogenase [Cephalotrichum gorgonifer]|uniref:Probable cellobiose dehydrogenase n=1 Tax=Cephalotrichum gorgonifer TaxID=2041049 RepID=A0AAE8N3D1_9PEZI|nr:probable cellobiose dehydrogenase [Cephalotrichum gorgonifer]
MHLSRQLPSALVAFASLWATSNAQSRTPVVYTDADTGIVFDTWATSTGLTMGFAMPEDALTVDATEYIGLLTCSSKNGNGVGWCGISLGGSMTNKLLLMAWPSEGEVLTQLMWASGYDLPVAYTGDAKITQISSHINDTHYELIYRCEGCLQWDQGGATGGLSSSSGFALLGWAHANDSPGSPECAAKVVPQQHDAQSLFPATPDEAIANPSYTDWAALATKTVTGNCGGGPDPTGTDVPTATPTDVPVVTGIPVPTETAYDYVIVGGGAGGLPLADKLSEAGKKVLLIEKGGASTGRWGGKKKPEWLEGTDLTRFDVPGLCNQIWVDSAGIACTDMDQMAGCLLGGGTAVNAGLWWKPYSQDWDYNFPNGWKASDVKGATDRVFSKIPGTMTPSMDGKRYLQQGFDVVAGGLGAAGWKSVAANDVPNEKNRTFTHPPFMFAGGERNGPLATYLVSASGRSNFDMWLGTSVKRIVRTSGHATGLEVEATLEGGYVGTVPLTPETGRVILSAGTFGSAKVLLRSGIGPLDQLQVVKSSADGPTMIDEADWLELPVGENLEDHTNTDTVIAHPSVEFYDFYEAWDTPNAGDKSAYLDSRSGILAQAAPNIGPVFFEEIAGRDGTVRQLQWTARVEASLGETSLKAITMSQYLGRGAKSRGKMTITPTLNTAVTTHPYLRDSEDVEAVIKGIENLQAALSGVEGLEWLQPAPGVTAREYVEDMLVSPSNRRANHWIGTCKLGTDDGRRSDGRAVVDTNTRVWGTDNIFVVDASIFPGMVTANPSAAIVVASEHAASKILALPVAKAGQLHAQCAGLTWTGSFQCAAGLVCKEKDKYYSQCLAA